MEAEEEGFVHLQADNFLYSDAQIQAFLKVQQPFVCLSSLLPGGAVASYPPLNAQDRLRLLYQTPSALTQAQLTYYLLRDRALDLALAPPPVEPHPHAVLWAARNPLKLSPSQIQLTDALWLIDHAHLDSGIDTLLSLPPSFTLDQDILTHLFFRLEAEAELERTHIASWHPSIRNHAGIRPPAARRLVQFATHFQSAGIDALFESNPDAVRTFLVSLCRISSLANARDWLHQRYAHRPSDLYNDLLIALVESIAAPNPLRRQLFELVSLPFSASDLHILQSHATSVPPSSTDTLSSTSNRKIRAIIAETLFVRYIHRGQYAEALALDAQLQLLSQSFDPTLFEFPKATRAATADGDDIQMAGTEADAEAAEFEARRKRRADLLRAARDVMPDVQRALLDVKRVQSALDAVNPGSSGLNSGTGTGIEGSWQDVSQEEAGVAAEEPGQPEVEAPVRRRPAPASSAFSGRKASTSSTRPLVPLTSSAALRAWPAVNAGGNSGTSSASTGTPSSSTILHASDPQAALISALVSSNVDEISSGAPANPSRASAGDVSVSGQANRSFGSFSNIGARPSPTGSRPIAAATSAFAGGAPSPQSFGSPRHRLTSRAASATPFLDVPSPGADQSANLSQNGLHLAYMFRQPERRYVATVDIAPPSSSTKSTLLRGSTERWAADQNMLLAGGEGDESLAKIPFPGEEEDDDEDGDGFADNTFRNAPVRHGRGVDSAARTEKEVDVDEDGDMSVQMPGAWDPVAATAASTRGNKSGGSRATNSRKTTKSQGGSNKRGAISSGEEGGASGHGMDDDEVVTSQSRSARTKRSRRTPTAASSTPAAVAPGKDVPGPASSTPAAKRTSNVLASSGTNGRRSRGGPTGVKAPSGLRRMTRASSVLSTSSVSSSVNADEEGMEVDGGEEEDALPDMVEVEGNAPPTVLARTTTTASKTGSALRKSRASASSSATAAAPSASRSSSRRSSRLASQEPSDAADPVTSGGGGGFSANDILEEEETEGEATADSASVSEAGETETETEGDEVEGETKGKAKRGKAKAGSGANKKKATSAAAAGGSAKPRKTRAGRTSKRA
ncbi:hypothetical protein OC845_004096 [Tilletia horrida]|nr:hypothetical protein OC845_004096 [Tilletia horrida]